MNIINTSASCFFFISYSSKHLVTPWRFTTTRLGSCPSLLFVTLMVVTPQTLEYDVSLDAELAVPLVQYSGAEIKEKLHRKSL